MDIFLITLLALGCLVLFGTLCVATKSKNDGCLPLLLLFLLMLVFVFVLSLLD